MSRDPEDDRMHGIAAESPCKTSPSQGGEREPIAIIGIGCRFPGDASDAESFWKLLTDGIDAITEIPQDRWNIDAFYHPVPGTPGKTYARWGGFIKGIDQFEPECFGISPREASYIDPQQRLLLEVAWEALEDGGQAIDRLAGTSTGVFVGISTSDYSHSQSTPYDNRSIGAYSAMGGAYSIAANRISYCLDLRGPSIAVDTACSSSLVATHLACQSIWNHECDMALAGGVNIIVLPPLFIGFCAAAMLSPDGRCKAFDASANGFVRSEGCGIVVLKPLSRAIADRDSIYAVVLSSAVNQDGRTTGIAAPSLTAQAALMAEACRQAGIAPREVQYVEAHGTGTAIGDPIEANALGTVLSPGRLEGRHCVIGSVKTNIGHLEAAAGVAGVIKAALALKYRMIPPNLHFVRPNPEIRFEELQLRVPRFLEPWPDDPGPAIAGVNSFGFGGTNAHVVLREAPAGSRDVWVYGRIPTHPHAHLLPLSARTPEALQALVQSYVDLLDRNGDYDDASLPDACYTASVRRTHFEHRLSLVAHSKEELLEHLGAFLGGESRTGMFTGRRVPGQAPKPVFVFSGQGSQWWGMGRELLETEPIFRSTIEACDALLRQHADWSLMEELTADERRSRLEATAIAQPALFALQAALAALWKSWGIEPAAVVGHSVGEVAAVYIAGALRLEDAVRVIFHRGRCMDRASSQGRMLAVGLSMSETEQAIQGYEDRVSLAATNSPASATLSGDPDILAQIADSLSAMGVFCRFLTVNYAFHSPQMEPLKDELLASLDGLDPQPADLLMISTVTGEPLEAGQCDRRYWWQNIRKRVRFAEAVDRLIERDYDTFVELSPHPVLSSSISECLRHRERQGAVLPSLRRLEKERATMLASLGALYTLGHPVDWQNLWPEGGRSVHLPGYPWQRQHYWHEPEELRDVRVGRKKHPLLGRRIGSASPLWESVVDRRLLSYLEDHRVQGGYPVFPAAAYLEMALRAAQEILGGEACILEEVRFQKALFLLDGDEAPTVQLGFSPADTSFAIHSRAPKSEQAWVLHTIGYLRTQQELPPPQKVDIRAIMNDLPEEVSAEGCYGALAAMGLPYGPAFRGIERLWRTDGQALGQVRLRDHLEPESSEYCFHPALLDACIQVACLAIPRDHDAMRKTRYLPVRIERVRFYRRPGHQVWSHVHLTNMSPNVLVGDTRVYDENGSLLMELEAFTVQAVRRERDDLDDAQKWFYELKWQHKPCREQPVSRRSADFIGGSREIAQVVTGELQQLDGATGWSAGISNMDASFHLLSIAYIVQAMHDLGWPWKLADPITINSLMERLNVVSQYQLLMRRFVQMLAEAGYLRRTGPDAWMVDRVPPEEDPQLLWQAAMARHPAFLAELTLIGRGGAHLAATLRGEKDPLQVIFPNGSTTMAEHLYQDSPSFWPYNIAIQKVVIRALGRLPEAAMVRILEVGAGTGSTTAYVLPRLPVDRTEYVFSDITQLFLSRAEQKFRDYPFLSFRLLDIEKDPLEQGFEPHSFDVILASVVLHATSDLRNTLRNILKLLASDGLLILLEDEKASSWVDLVFGMTEGWWRFRDFDLRPEHPFINRSTWHAVLEEVGFRDVAPLCVSRDEAASRFVMLARGPSIRGSAPVTELQTDPHLSDDEQGNWLIFADSGGVAQELARLLELQGDASLLVKPGERFQRLGPENFQIAPDNPEDFERLLQVVAASHKSGWRGAIHLWSLDTHPPGECSLETLQGAEVLGCHTIMHFMQALSKMNMPNASPRLILVTRAAQPVCQGRESVSIGQSPLIGLGRVITHEYPNIRCKLVDLSPDDSPEEIPSLLAELLTEDPEEEIALRHGARFVPRVERSTAHRVPVERNGSEDGYKTPFRLEILTPGVLDNLTLRETTRQQPGPGQVEIKVCAASLNFRDVMKALGLVPTDGDDSLVLGDECAGRIVAIGTGVEGLTVGDEVIAIAPASFGSFVTTLAAAVVHKPAHLTFEEAVTIPIAF